MNSMSRYRFCLAWLMPVLVGIGTVRSGWAALAVFVAFQLILALVELVPGSQRSIAPEEPTVVHRAVLVTHVGLQAGLLLLGVGAAVEATNAYEVIALALAVGGVTGSQGFTVAHELGHSRRKIDRLLAWALTGSVLYAHFMVEHYQGHHRRAASVDDPASARLGESLWRFLPRTVVGSFKSAWRLEGAQLSKRKRGWSRSGLACATAFQTLLLVAVLAMGGWYALLFWVVQAIYAIFLLESVNYIEHYGLTRGRGQPFAVRHAWNADHTLTNCFLFNLQRHSDHHVHPWKTYEELGAVGGPQLPTGYAGCIYLATVPTLWRRLMDAPATRWNLEKP